MSPSCRLQLPSSQLLCCCRRNCGDCSLALLLCGLSVVLAVGSAALLCSLLAAAVCSGPSRSRRWLSSFFWAVLGFQVSLSPLAVGSAAPCSSLPPAVGSAGLVGSLLALALAVALLGVGLCLPALAAALPLFRQALALGCVAVWLCGGRRHCSWHRRRSGALRVAVVLLAHVGCRVRCCVLCCCCRLLSCWLGCCGWAAGSSSHLPPPWHRLCTLSRSLLGGPPSVCRISVSALLCVALLSGRCLCWGLGGSAGLLAAVLGALPGVGLAHCRRLPWRRLC